MLSRRSDQLWTSTYEALLAVLGNVVTDIFYSVIEFQRMEGSTTGVSKGTMVIGLLMLLVVISALLMSMVYYRKKYHKEKDPNLPNVQ